MRRADVWWKRLLVALLTLPFQGLYTLANRVTAEQGRYYVVRFPVDDRIPLVRVFILPYYAWYFLVAGALIWLVFDKRTGRLLSRYAAAICLAETIAFAVYMIFPTQIARPDVAGQDLLSGMVRLIYRVDYPYNCFPSMHVCLAALTAYVIHLAGPRHFLFRFINVTVLILITFSTVLTKQHYTPDILGGLFLAWAAWQLAGPLLRLFGNALGHITSAGTGAA